MIVLNALQIGYKDVLFSVPSLELESGQVVTLIGPNGAGKTTFLNTLLGIHSPIKGTINYNGLPLSQFNKKERVRLISHVSSKFEGVDYLSVIDLIAMGRAPYTNQLNILSKKDWEVVNNVLDLLELSVIAQKDTKDISDGERQIAMIGKALAQDTQLIVLDEPTAFLDYTNRRKVLRLLSKVAKEQDKLIILTSHDLALTFEYSDIILGVDAQHKVLNQYSPNSSQEEVISAIFGQ